MRRATQQGFTLVEVIVAIAIISVAIGGVMLVFVVALSHSADPQQQQQAVAIAEGYMDEILSRRFEDPDGVASVEASRGLYDDVDDYGTISNEQPRDQEGAVLSGLSDYRVQVTVSASGAFGPAGQTVPAKRIDVTVTRPPLVQTTLTAYKVQN